MNYSQFRRLRTHVTRALALMPLALMALALLVTEAAVADKSIYGSQMSKLQTDLRQARVTIAKQKRAIEITAEAIKEAPAETRRQLAAAVHITRSCVSATPGFDTSCKASRLMWFTLISLT